MLPFRDMEGFDSADCMGRGTLGRSVARGPEMNAASSPAIGELLRLAAGPVGLMVRLPLIAGPSLIGDLEAAQLITGALVEADDERGPVVMFSATRRGRECLARSHPGFAECPD